MWFIATPYFYGIRRYLPGGVAKVLRSRLDWLKLGTVVSGVVTTGITVWGAWASGNATLGAVIVIGGMLVACISPLSTWWVMAPRHTVNQLT